MAIDSDSPTSFCSSCLICAKLVLHPKVRLKLNNCNLPTRPHTGKLFSQSKTPIKKTVTHHVVPVSKKHMLTFAKCVSKFCELFNSPPDNTFEKDFNEIFKFSTLSSTCPVCKDCQNRIRLISKIMTHIETLQSQLIKLKQSVEKDLNIQISDENGSKQILNNKEKFFIDRGFKTRLFREKLKERLQISLAGAHAMGINDVGDSTKIDEINSSFGNTDPSLFDGTNIESQFTLTDDDLNFSCDDFDVKPNLDNKDGEDDSIDYLGDIQPEWYDETRQDDDTENEVHDSTNTHICASVQIEGTARILTLSHLKEPVVIDTSLHEKESDIIGACIQGILISEPEPGVQTCLPASESGTKFAKKRKQPRTQLKDKVSRTDLEESNIEDSNFLHGLQTVQNDPLIIDEIESENGAYANIDKATIVEFAGATSTTHASNILQVLDKSDLNGELEPKLILDTKRADTSRCVQKTGCPRLKDDPFGDPMKRRKQIKCTFVDPVKGQCKIRVTHQDRLDAHINRFHKNNPIQDPKEKRRRLQCTFVDPVKGQCKITLQDQDRLVAHINRVHENIPEREAFKCNNCPFATRTMKSLNLHRKIHAGVKDVTCEICGMSFRSERSLIHHKRRKHEEPFPFQCDICKKGFNENYSLKAHQYENHNYGDGNYTHRCSICDAGFYMKLRLNVHMLKHVEPTFQCDECPKKFKSKQRLQLHMITHSGIRNFVCDVCDWRFYTKDKLRVHKSIHTKTRPFLCTECGFSCRLPGLLKSHLTVHENNKSLAEKGIEKPPRLAKPRNRRIKIYENTLFPPSAPTSIQNNSDEQEICKGAEAETQQVESKIARE